jgi:ACS family glucarate transporter-like MFS transporter
MTQSPKPTNVRHVVVGLTAFSAFLMYLDRLCISQMVNADSFHRDLGFTPEATGTVLSVFFLAYALGQVPAGWLADRFGARPLMTAFIALWSGFTVLTGLALGFWTLVIARIGCGLSQAGAFPASGGLVSRWVPLHGRGRASSIVAGGGRLGGAVAPFLTAAVILWLGDWRAAGWIFGGVGLAFAVVFWVLLRDRPRDHPLVNAAEYELITRDLPPEQAAARGSARLPIRGLLRSRSMWLMCLYQCLTNLGWAFLATLMPTFLKQAKGLDDVATGTMSTVALTVGMAGMLCGGWLTDALTRRLGVRQGRMIPLAWSRFVGAGAYLACLWLQSPWACVAAFAVVAVMTDVGVPAVWAYTQDVGGRNVASVLAWPNMWGNFGAAATSGLLPWINRRFDANHDWHESLIFLAVAFILSGVVAFGIRADVKIDGTGRDDDDAPEPRSFPVLPATGPTATPGARPSS